ncbi:MAG: ActS/PrrB/RegB family redox-sensitive histidine kinase [Pseudomonadota bacterium]
MGLRGGNDKKPGDRLSVIGTAPGVRLKTLVNLRWVAVTGQTLALLFVRFYLGYPFAELPAAAAAVAALAATNLYLQLSHPAERQLTGREASLQLAFDLLQLTLLLFLTGGLTNPFALLILVPVTISATILSGRSTVSLLVLAGLCLAFLARFHLPLPWGAEPLQLAPTYLVGVGVALVIAMGFVAAYAWRVSAEGRRRSQALVATQEALAREQKLSALGSLAAAAAHELGTPLGTITLISKELLREHGNDPVLAEDLRLLESQSQRCREILANLSRRAESEDAHFKRAPIEAVLREVAKPHEDSGLLIVVTARPAATTDGAQPVIARRPEILHSLGNFIENASRFAHSRVDLDLEWDASRVRLVISDDGPGFDADILNALGEPYLPSRAGVRGAGGGMGLGVFIAATLLERTGATILYHNGPEGGAVVDIAWPRSAIEEKGEAWETATR